MTKLVVLAILMAQSMFSLAACLSDAQLDQIKNAEITYLTEKIPPAFKHQLLASKITVNVEAVEDEQCQANLIITIPQQDVDEAHQILDAQPAKKIMLSAQGQALPDGARHAALFEVNANNLAVSEKDILQTAALGKLRASLELMYALLTQQYAQVSETQSNEQPWTAQMKAQSVNRCIDSQTEAVCRCLADQYSARISPNQMEYIEYVQANPYALATGANNGFENIKSVAAQACQ